MSEITALLERYRDGAEEVAAVLNGISAAEADFTPAPGKWSIRKIAAHLADAELVGAHRFRQVIAEEQPTIMAFDQEAWARNLDYARRIPELSLETFRRLRAENYELLKELPASIFDRTGNHSVNGVMTLRQMLDGYASHAESHARQLRHVREAFRKSQSA